MFPIFLWNLVSAELHAGQKYVLFFSRKLTLFLNFILRVSLCGEQNMESYGL